MKIAIIGSCALDSLESNLKEAFVFNGNECKIFDVLPHGYIGNKYIFTVDKLLRSYSDRYDSWRYKKLSVDVLDYHPDLVICVYRFIHPLFVSLLKKWGNFPVVHVNPDALTTFEYQQVFASDYNVWFTKDPYIVKFMRNNMHLNAVLYNEAFNKRLHKKPSISKEEAEVKVNIDVMTYGTIYPYRSNMLKCLLKEGIHLSIFGTKPHRFYDPSLDPSFINKYITGREKAELLYGAKIVFNQMHYAEIESVNNRFFEVNGCGAFQLSDYRPILKELLPIDPELVSFRTIDEGMEKIRYYLAHPKERHEIADQVYQHFIGKYSYDELVSFILNNI